MTKKDDVTAGPEVDDAQHKWSGFVAAEQTEAGVGDALVFVRPAGEGDLNWPILRPTQSCGEPGDVLTATGLETGPDFEPIASGEMTDGFVITAKGGERVWAEGGGGGGGVPKSYVDERDKATLEEANAYADEALDEAADARFAPQFNPTFRGEVNATDIAVKHIEIGAGTIPGYIATAKDGNGLVEWKPPPGTPETPKWREFTPSFLGSLSLGDGRAFGFYRIIGNVCTVRLLVDFGSTTAFTGDGGFVLDPPPGVTPGGAAPIGMSPGASGNAMFYTDYYADSQDRYIGHVMALGDLREGFDVIIYVRCLGPGGSGQIKLTELTSDSPFTWAKGARIELPEFNFYCYAQGEDEDA